jgi:hypothetical protein
MLIRALFILFGLLPLQLFACGVERRIPLSNVLDADTIVVGRVERYENFSSDRRSGLDYALVQVWVRDVLKGGEAGGLNEQDRILVMWDPSKYQRLAPEPLDVGGTYAFALRQVPSPLPERPWAIRGFTRESAIFNVLRTPCAGVHIFDNTSVIGSIIFQASKAVRDPIIELIMIENYVVRGYGSLSRQDIIDSFLGQMDHLR